MDLNLDKLIQSTKLRFQTDKVFPYSHGKAAELIKAGYHYSFTTFDITYNCIYISFIKIPKDIRKPVKCIVLIAELKEY